MFAVCQIEISDHGGSASALLVYERFTFPRMECISQVRRAGKKMIAMVYL